MAVKPRCFTESFVLVRLFIASGPGAIQKPLAPARFTLGAPFFVLRGLLEPWWWRVASETNI